MIIVLGSVVVQDDKLAEAVKWSLEHVARSRLEPGCIEHGVSLDVEAGNRLVFVERWESMDALMAHFAVPASGKFVQAVSALASEPPSMTLYESSEVTPGARSRPASPERWGR
jgi:quinol monooxygenase YgiN